MTGSSPRLGVWLVGARGSVATTTLVGAAALTADLAKPIGLVTGLPPFTDSKLPALGELVFGGHDVVATPLHKRAEQLASAGVLPQHLLAAVAPALAAAEENLRMGVTAEHTDPQRVTVTQLVADLRDFAERHRLARTVVVHIASTEAPVRPCPAYAELAALEEALQAGHSPLPPSSLYAYAAFQAGCSFIEFTPSASVRLPAIAELARARGLPYAGGDGKTGETLVKTALAAMFADRALRVRSWSGSNLLGGGDGAALADPERARSKLASKSNSLEVILGYPVCAPVHIDYVEDQGEWKTAWDHVGFEGFLGTRMQMQFTWQGCDSALAAPLVLDLVRLVARAHQRGRSGPLGELGFFFKVPLGRSSHRLDEQWVALRSFAEQLGRAG